MCDPRNSMSPTGFVAFAPSLSVRLRPLELYPAAAIVGHHSRSPQPLTTPEHLPHQLRQPAHLPHPPRRHRRFVAPPRAVHQPRHQPPSRDKHHPHHYQQPQPQQQQQQQRHSMNSNSRARSHPAVPAQNGRYFGPARREELDVNHHQPAAPPLTNGNAPGVATATSPGRSRSSNRETLFDPLQLAQSSDGDAGSETDAFDSATPRATRGSAAAQTSTLQPHPRTAPVVDTVAEPHAPHSQHADSGMLTLELAGRKISFPGRYLLYGVPFLWGTFGPAVRLLFAVEPHPPPSVFNTERLMLANAMYFPILIAEISAIRNRVSAKRSFGSAALANAPPAKAQHDEVVEADADPFLSLKAGVELGSWVFLANVAQVLGLEATSAGRAAFLVQLQTVFIPVIAGAFGMNKVGRSTWISSMIAITGVALLSLDKGHGSHSSVLGDSLEVLSAIFFSVYVIRLGTYCNRIAPGPLISIKILVQAALSGLWALGMEAWSLTSHPVMHNPEGPAPWTAHAIFVNVAVIAWTGIMSSAVSGWLQTKGQQYVPASESAVIFATQPLWASATAAVLLGETFGTRGVGGGALIVLATAFAALSDARSKDDDNVNPLEQADSTASGFDDREKKHV